MARCVGGTESYWHDFYATLLPCDVLGARVDAGEMLYNASSAQACLAAIRREGEGCNLSGTIPECTDTLKGNVAAGGACHSDGLSVCDPQADCRAVADSCSDTCVARVPVDGSCAVATGTAPPCAEGATCVSGVCVADPGEGQSCRGLCAGSLRCVGATAAAPGTCQRGATSGPCTTISDCDTYYTCTGAIGARTCSKYRMLGESCVPGQSQCWWLLHCGSDGTCSDAKAAANEACGADANGEHIPCGANLYCSLASGTAAGTCVAKKAAGTPCSSDSECAGTNAYCDDATGKCVGCS